MQTQAVNVARRIALLYCLVASLWILLSDQLVEQLAPTPNLITVLQTYKGWFFVVVTSLLLYALIHHQLVRWMREAESSQRTKAALEESEARYKNLFEHNPFPMWVYDLETLAFLAVNQAAVEKYGYPRDELLALTIKDIRPEEDVPTLLENVAAARPALQHSGEWRHRLKDGRIINVEISSHRLKFEGREAALVLAQDITARKKLEKENELLAAQFYQAQKMESIGILAGGIAHDFNNLLVPILGYAELGMTAVSEEDELYDNFEQIMDAASRAANLTRQILVFSRQQVLDVQVLNLNEVIREFQKMLRRLVGEDVIFQTHLADTLPLIKADQGQLEQVLLNLVVNARDAMPQGGVLTIETTSVALDEAYVTRHPEVKPGTYVLLAVSDTGHGIDAVTRQRIFEPFFTTKPRGRGTGLGLATVFGIVKQHNGHIWVYSEPGQGTTFKIFLPAAASPAQTGEKKRQPDTHLLRGTETVLLVEDEPSIRRLVCDTLETHGYQVLEAHTPERGLYISAAHTGPLHLLLTDMVMPVMNGRELYQQLARERPDLKVLYMSGYTDKMIVRQGVADDQSLFLQKPFTIYMLLQKVRAALT